MSQETTPSTSAGVRPASAKAASEASVAIVTSLRPEFLENSVAPIPEIAQRSRGNSMSATADRLQNLIRVLAKTRGASGSGGFEAAEPVRATRLQCGAPIGLFDRHEELARDQVLVDE